MKKYIAKTNVAINVVLPSGKNKHVSFSPLSSGGSVFYTDDENLQSALEGHYKYGKLFKAVNVECALKNAFKPVISKSQAEEILGKEANDGTLREDLIGPDNHTNELPNLHANVKIVTDFEDARNWLSETYGVSRTKLRSLKAVKEYAESVGVELQGI